MVTNLCSRPMGPTHHAFEPLASSHEASETGFRAQSNLPVERNSDGVSAESGLMGSPLPQPHSHEAMDAAVTRGGDVNYDSDRVPLTRELDDFSHGFNSALEGIDTDSDGEANQNNMATYPGPRRGGGGGGVLWQQNRRRSRNLAWM